MALVLSLVIISLSILAITSQEYKLSVEADARRIVANKEVGPRVIITGLVSPTPTLTLKPGAFLKILQNGKDKILQLDAIEPSFDEKRNRFITNIAFQEFAPDSDFFRWTPQQLTEQILAERVQLSKPLSVTFDEANNKVVIGGLADPKPVIEFKKGDTIKLDGKKGVIHTVESEEILFEQAKGQMDIDGELGTVYDDIGAGKLQYRDNEGQWHRVEPVYEAIKPTEMDAAKWKHYKLKQSNNYPKKDEIKHWPQHKRKDILNYAGDNEKYRGVALLHYDDPDGKYGYYKSLCTGALIIPPKGVNGHFVLTAAHCFWNPDIPDPDQPDPNFKKWRPQSDQMSFQFGVLKQGKLSGDAVDIGIEKVMIPKQFAKGAKYPDIAVVKLKGKVPDQWNHPFQVHAFIDSENEVGTKYDFVGYGGRRTMQVTELHLVDKKKWKSSGRIECFGFTRPGDSGGPLLRKNTDKHIVREIVGIHAAGFDPPTVSNGNNRFSLKDMKPDFTAISGTLLTLINDMMKGDYDDKKVEVETFGAVPSVEARAAYYDDEQYEYYDDYSLLDEARDNLVSAQMQFKAAQRLLKMKRKSRRYR